MVSPAPPFPQNLLWREGNGQKPLDKNSGHSHGVVVSLGSSLICSAVSLTPVSQIWVTTNTSRNLTLGDQTQIESLWSPTLFSTGPARFQE